MPDYSNLSDAELMALLQPQQQPLTPPGKYSGMSDADLLKLVQPQPKLSDAVTDIPNEVARTAGGNIDTIKDGFSNRGTKGPIEGLLGTGRAVLAIPGLLASPFTGAARSLIGHPMAQAEHAVGQMIAPEIAAKDDPQQMYDRAAGDVETALMAAKPSPRSVPVVKAPTIPELKSAARAGYDHPDVAAVDIKPQATSGLASVIENDLVKKGFRPNTEGPVFDIVRELDPPPSVSAVKVADIDSARKALGNIAKERDAVGAPTSRAAAASIAREHINDFLPGLSQSDVLAGDAQRAAQIMQEAQGNWGAAKRAEAVDLQLTRADRQAAKSGSGSNIENSMRQKIATLLDNPKRTVGYSEAEKQAMEKIVRGTFARNALRKAGKLGVDGGLSLLLHGGAMMKTGGLNLPVAIAATGARKVGEALTAKSGSSLSEMIRGRSPLANSNQGLAAVQHALTTQTPYQRAALTQAAIVSAILGDPQFVNQSR